MRRYPTIHLLPPLALAAVLSLGAAGAASATVTVTVSAPANNANVPSSFNVVASATTDAGGARVTGWYIYVDSVANWNTSGPTKSMACSGAPKRAARNSVWPGKPKPAFWTCFLEMGAVTRARSSPSLAARTAAST